MVDNSPNQATSSVKTVPPLPPVTPVPPMQKPEPAGEFVPPIDPLDVKVENTIANTTLSGGTTTIPDEQQTLSQGLINNEIIKPKLNYSILAIVAGVVLLIITSTFYYFMVYSKQPKSVEDATSSQITTENQPQVEPEIIPQVEQLPPVAIENDPVIQALEKIGSSENPNQIEDELDSIDFEGIDTELQLTDFQ